MRKRLISAFQAGNTADFIHLPELLKMEQLHLKCLLGTDPSICCWLKPLLRTVWEITRLEPIKATTESMLVIKMHGWLLSRAWALATAQLHSLINMQARWPVLLHWSCCTANSSSRTVTAFLTYCMLPVCLLWCMGWHKTLKSSAALAKSDWGVFRKIFIGINFTLFIEAVAQDPDFTYQDKHDFG